MMEAVPPLELEVPEEKAWALDDDAPVPPALLPLQQPVSSVILARWITGDTRIKVTAAIDVVPNLICTYYQHS